MKMFSYSSLSKGLKESFLNLSYKGGETMRVKVRSV